MIYRFRIKNIYICRYNKLQGRLETYYARVWKFKFMLIWNILQDGRFQRNWFVSDPKIFIPGYSKTKVFNSLSHDIHTRVDNYIKRGSGWVIYKIREIKLKTYTYKPIGGGGGTDVPLLPRWVKSSVISWRKGDEE